MDMQGAIVELRRRREQALNLGGPERIARQHARGLLTARERLDILLDTGPRFEVTPTSGFGRVEERLVAYHATDATVKGGSGGDGAMHRARLVRSMANKAGLPLLDLAQGGGASIPGIMGSRLAGNDGGVTLGTEMARPRRGLRLMAVLGNYFAPWSVGLSDLAIMTKNSYCAIASPPIIEEATGETITEAQLGGWEVQSKITGQIDVVGEDDPDAIRLMREVFSYLPGNVFEEPPIKWSGDPVERRDEALLSLVPDGISRAYDMRRLLRHVVDDGVLFELKPSYGRALIIALARMGGYPVGIIANQPLYEAGSLDHEAFFKAMRLIELCGTFHIPMLFFLDLPGVLVGSRQEHNQILAKSMKYMIALVEADVPKISVVVRKAYGLGYFAMNGSSAGRKFTFAWPSASIAFMGPEPGVRVVYRRQLEEAPDPRALLNSLAEQWRHTAEPWEAAKLGLIVDVIDPRDTRPLIVQALGYGLGIAKANKCRWPADR